MYRAQRMFGGSGMPVSMGLLVVSVAGFLVVWLSSGSPGAVERLARLTFHSGEWGERPWSLVTYGLLVPEPFLLLFIGLAFYYFAGTLERVWGSRRFGLAFVGVALLVPLSFWLGYVITGVGTSLVSWGLPAACCIVAWSSMYPNQPVMLWFVIPVLGKWIGIFTAVLTVILYGFGFPPMAIFAAIPIVASWAYATGRIRLPSIPERPEGKRSRFDETDYRGFDYDKRMEAEHERRKLRELFERSFGDEDDDEGKSKK